MQLKETTDGGTTVELNKHEEETVRKAQKILAMAAKGISDANISVVAVNTASALKTFIDFVCPEQQAETAAAAK